MIVPGRGGPAGYAHPGYAVSFGASGAPCQLKRCEGWIIERAIPDTELRDAMGCYPIFACRDWARLEDDLAELSGRLVSLSLVADPFGNFDESLLRRCFDIVRHYKDHFVTDLEQPLDGLLPRRHRRNVAHARETIRVEVCERPMDHLDEWVALYAKLIQRHGITGIRAFSREAFEHQLAVPGLVMLRASAEEELVGMHLWYVQGDVAYGHLGATNDLGYELMASYGLYSSAVELLRERVRWLELGAGAGLVESDDGLSAFKRGWATGTRPAYLCGRVFQPEAYERLNDEQVDAAGYFPAYRAGEFSGETADSDPSASS